MTVDWAPLDQELDLWRKAGLTLLLWWRDDDAIAVTDQLQRLTELAEHSGLPVHLAVIPAHAKPELAAYVATHPALFPMVHGWAHENHAPAGEKKAEYRLHRPLAEITAEAVRGMARLQNLFGPALRPAFVPPWNRIAPEVAAELPALGYRVLSTSTPRKRTQAAPGLLQINTHLDPIDWHGNRSLIAPASLIAQLVRHLQDRRDGRADNSEPYGLLTHHLVHDQDIWDFVKALIIRLMAGPVRVASLPEN